jgi:hypothetical protein
MIKCDRKLINYLKHCKLEFSEYLQTHEEHNNKMDPRTEGAVALRTTGNAQGSYLFFSLNSGKVVTRNRWTVLPMPDNVIKRVKAMGSIYQDDTCGYENDPDSIHEPIDSEEDLLRTKDEAETGEDNMINPQQDPAIDIIEDKSCLEEPEGEDIQDTDVLEEDAISNVKELEDNNELIDEAENVGNLVDNDQNIEQSVELNLEDEMELRYGARSGRYDLRPRRPCDYSHLHATMDHTCMTQYNLKRDL